MSQQHPYRLLFVHISKCGGTSITSAPFVMVHGSPQLSPKTAMEDLGIKESFAFVRNPYSRFTSAVFNHGYATPKNFEEWVEKEFLPNYEKHFADFNTRTWQELMPQHKYLVHDGVMDIDYVGYLKDIGDDWKEVCDRVGEHFDLPHLNKSAIKEHWRYHTPKTIEAVKKAYAEDFKLLKYSPLDVPEMGGKSFFERVRDNYRAKKK